MKNNILTITFLIAITLLSSCRKEVSNEGIKEKEKYEEESYLDLYFPDTVNIKNVYEGEIKYRGALDSITTRLFKKGDSLRMITLYINDNEELIENNYEHILKNRTTDTFYPINDEQNIVFRHKFNRLGINYLEGVLEDEVYFKESDTSKLRIITNYSHITLKVYVTNDENIIDSYFKPEGIKLPKRI